MSLPADPAFLFSGQLAETMGMGRDFFEADPEARDLFRETSGRCGIDLEEILFSGPEERVHENLAAQAGVFLVSTLSARALARRGVFPAATAGYSLGNYAAMVAAGTVSYEDALDVLVSVWRETERLRIRGAMGAIVGARREAVEAACGELRARGLPVWIGNINASTQFVVTGTPPAVEAALAELAPRSLRVLPLPMNWPIHCELMGPVAAAIAGSLESLGSIRDPAIPFFGPDGKRVQGAADIRRYLATEFVHPTQWNSTVEAMVRDGHRVFLEVGPGDMLTKMTRWIDRTITCTPAGTVAAVEDVSRIFRPDR